MSPMDESGAPARWDLLDDKLLTACRVWDLRARRYRHPTKGNEGEFYYIISRDWVIVIARTRAAAVVPLDETQHALVLIRVIIHLVGCS